MRRFFSFIKFLFALFLIGAAFLVLAGLWFIKDLPSPERILINGPAESTKIYDRTGKILLYQIGEERRSVISLDQIPPHVRWATLVAEDVDFYKHPGIDITGIIRAAWYDITKRSLQQGGSTISQQFVKNAILSPEKKFSRKFKELLLSIWLEAQYSKDQILEFYLNQIPYGGNTYGIEQASRLYFGKPTGEVSIAQAALLAALPQRPSYFSPRGEHVKELMARKNWIITRMKEEGYITKDEEENAKKEEIVFTASRTASIIAPHFVMWVKEYLEKTYGVDMVERGGLEVITSLDARLQAKAEESVSEIAKKNEKQYRAKNASLVALDPRTGQVLAMVGSRDWFDDAVDGKVNVALRLRQPGSAFKPIAYAKLFEEGFGPESLIFDLRTTFKTRAGQNYTPINFDGRSHGLLTIRQALAQSRNVPAVKTLYLAGIDNVISLAKKMGINTINPKRVDLALVLGGAEVRLLDLTAAYGVFASDGMSNQPQAILRVKNSEKEVLEEFTKRSRKALNPEITRLITSILSDNETRSTVFGPSSPLYIPGIATAAKTGTTSDFRDGWTIGYTPRLVVGVWAGNNDNTPTYRGEGAFVAGPIWNKLIRFAAGTYPAEFGGTFPDPLPHRLLNKPMASGLLTKSDGQVHSALYYMRPNDPQVGAWEKPIKEWVIAHPEFIVQVPPINEEENNKNPAPYAYKPTLQIITPRDGTEVPSSLSLEFAFTGAYSLRQVDVFLDDDLIASESQSPIQLNLSRFLEGDHILRIRAFDQNLNTTEKEVYIILKKEYAETE